MFNRFADNICRGDDQEDENGHPQINTDIRKVELVKKACHSEILTEMYRQARNGFGDFIKAVNESKAGTPGCIQFPKELHIPEHKLQIDLKSLHDLWKSFTMDWKKLSFVIEEEDPNLDAAPRAEQIMKAGKELHKALNNFPVWMNYYKSIDLMSVRIYDRALDYVCFTRTLPALRRSETYRSVERELKESEAYRQMQNEMDNDPVFIKLNHAVKVLGEIPPD